MSALATDFRGLVATALLAFSLFAVTASSLLSPQSPARKAWDRHVQSLHAEVQFQMLRTTGKRIARAQLAAIVVLLFSAALLYDPLPLFASALVWVGPSVVLRGRRVKRVLQMEAQLDPWLVALGNGLKVAPSLGDALESTLSVTPPPLRDEIDLVVKETKLGTPLDQAIHNLSDRIGSQMVSSALITILVGRDTGGDLPRILHESAATLREMARLEGVVRTKTAEGKAQSYVLAAVPFLITAGIQALDPNWFSPLTSSLKGYLIILAAVALWLVGVLSARKILHVDI